MSQKKIVSGKDKRKSRGIKAGIIAFGVVFALYAVLFPLYRIGDYILAAAVSILIGKVISIMAQGLDLSPNKQQATEPEPLPLTGDAQADEIIQRGQTLMEQIREEDKLIPDAALSKQMVELDGVLTRIFHTVAEQPKKAPQIRRFMDYYLPTTLKMLKSYRVMDQREVSGEKAYAARQRIANALGVVLRASEKQLETLYQDDMLDITTDIDVLEQMLKRDGLVDTAFTPMGNNKGGTSDEQ